jgi:phosphohistidine phosphatase SixA
MPNLNWDAPLQDIDRPLDQRGMKDAHLVSLNIKILFQNICHME